MIPDLAGALDAVLVVRQGSSACAGARVAPDRVLTAYHCVASGGRPSLETRSGARAVGRVVAVDRARDLALIAVDGLQGPALGLAASAPGAGAPVTAIGHPHGDAASGFFAGTLAWSLSEGVVAAVGERAIQTTAPLDRGHSGGPLLDADGRVVGVVSRRIGATLGFAGRAAPLPERALGPLGGTVAAELLLASHDPVRASAPGGLGAGARLEVALRDRLLVDGALLAPLSGPWTAATSGAAGSTVAEARAGLRARLGRGPWTVRIDALAGVAAHRTLRADDDDPLDLTRLTRPAWLAGGALRAGVAGLEVVALPDAGVVRTGVALRIPGTLGVF